MKRLFVVLVGLVIAFVVAPVHAVTMSVVLVGDAGNASDTAVMISDNTSGYGSVSYNYSMGKYDVTLTQYAQFLNDVAKSDPYALYNANMATNLNVAGIGRCGSSGSYSYSVIGSSQHPVTYVSWYDTIRFANWLTNGQGALASTETGTYTITGGGPNSGMVTIPNAAQRVTWASGNKTYWLLPSEDEWYKAAYYKSGGTNAGYWLNPTKSDLAPGNVFSIVGTNNANFYDGTNGFAVTQTTNYSSSQNYLTDVGAFSSSPGPYGTFDQGGNVYQWNEASIGPWRGLRGGGWTGLSSDLASSERFDYPPADEYYDIGFRVASVPEPGSVALLGIGAAGMALRWWRRRRTA